MRAARDVEVHSSSRDGTAQRRNRDPAEHACTPGVAAVVVASERKIDVGQTSTRLADELAHPISPELVRVSVEEDVELLLDLPRREEFRVGAPVKSLRARRAKLEHA